MGNKSVFVVFVQNEDDIPEMYAIYSSEEYAEKKVKALISSFGDDLTYIYHEEHEVCDE